ncbi:MAG: chemotaxis protein CheC [Thermoanaerobaculales bacterium]|nr:chemotaxis protein CheC [Thermoanaerobaculales bacterium]
MATMFFGQYLLAKGVIDRGALLDALDRQRRSNLSLPELAVQKGMMDRRRADSVVALFRMSEQPMEEILTIAGGLDAEQVQQLQNRQRSSWLRIGAALVEGGHLTEEEIAANLAVYQSLASAADQEIRGALKSVPDSAAVGACVELTVFHLERIVGREVRIESVKVEPDRLEEGLQRFSQRIVGDRDYTIAVDLPPPLMSSAAEGLLGFATDPGTEVEADAVCEIINLIGGNACTRIEQLGHVLRPEPPEWSGSGRLVSPTDEVVRASAYFADEVFDIRVFVGDGGGVR